MSNVGGRELARPPPSDAEGWQRLPHLVRSTERLTPSLPPNPQLGGPQDPNSNDSRIVDSSKGGPGSENRRAHPSRRSVASEVQEWSSGSIRESQGAPLTQILGLEMPGMEFWEHP